MKFTYISAALLAVASAITLKQVTVPTLLEEDSEPSLSIMVQVQDGHKVPDLAKELIAENPEFFSYLNRSWYY